MVKYDDWDHLDEIWKKSFRYDWHYRKTPLVQIWANSHHIVNETLHNLAEFTKQKVTTTHKEESRARLIPDRARHQKLCQLVSFILTHLQKSFAIFTSENHVQKRLTLVNPTKLELRLCLSFKEVYPKDFDIDCPVES